MQSRDYIERQRDPNLKKHLGFILISFKIIVEREV